MLYRYMAFNTWLYRDARTLQPYPTVLIREGKPVSNSDGDSTADAVDEALVEANTRERLVVHLSRSDIRYGPFHRRAYVKLFLETALPGEPERVQRIKFLAVLKRSDGRWTVPPESQVQLTLP